MNVCNSTAGVSETLDQVAVAQLPSGWSYHGGGTGQLTWCHSRRLAGACGVARSRGVTSSSSDDTVSCVTCF